jgi:hypothetical protein
MIITDTLNGVTVEDVRRNQDGSVTLFCDSGKVLVLYVESGRIEARLHLPRLEEDVTEIAPSERMRLLEAFQGELINYATYDDNGFINFVCEPHRHLYAAYTKSHGHRTILLTHHNGRIDELPPVSAVVALPSLAVFGKVG